MMHLGISLSLHLSYFLFAQSAVKKKEKKGEENEEGIASLCKFLSAKNYARVSGLNCAGSCTAHAVCGHRDDSLSAAERKLESR